MISDTEKPQDDQGQEQPTPVADPPQPSDDNPPPQPPPK